LYDAKKEYTISEVSEMIGYQPHVIRYYEKEFELEIPRNNSNHRYYTYKEIEIYNYIKAFQEKGFTNKQIKLILNSPELVVTDGETAITNFVKKDSDLIPSLTDIYELFKELIIEDLSPTLIEKTNISLNLINELNGKVDELRNEINNSERDILICENLKLKTQLKEKSFQVVELKDRLRKEQESSKGLFTKLFKKKQKNYK